MRPREPWHKAEAALCNLPKQQQADEVVELMYAILVELVAIKHQLSEMRFCAPEGVGGTASLNSGVGVNRST